MKQKMKQIIPDFLFDVLNEKRKLIQNRFLFKRDKKRFLKYYSRKNSTICEQIKAKILFYSHSIEKGLSHENIRLGFGKKTILYLLDNMSIYSKNNYDLEDPVYLNAVSIAKEYVHLHKNNSFNINYIPKKYEKLVTDCENSSLSLGGIKKFSSTTENRNKYRNFEELALNRHSVRDFSERPVDVSLIQSSIQIATKSPSVCNRQSSRVYILRDKDKIAKALQIQGGFNGYEIPPCLIAVTTDTRYFVNITERNQIYIDGGIFGMSLLYALEYNDLAACALNMMFDSTKEKKLEAF
ncbi:nitroreductase family protein [Listeria aquatica]|uniref:nitroreductase family protein n=1 Tax=Listeria aquatica TaxID=1494960 RepID=UPI003F72DF9C